MDSVGLPDPELYMLVSGKPSKQKILWQSMVNIAHVRAAVRKLKQINWLCANIDDGIVDDASRRIVESISDTTKVYSRSVDPWKLCVGVKYYVVHSCLRQIHNLRLVVCARIARAKACALPM